MDLFFLPSDPLPMLAPVLLITLTRLLPALQTSWEFSKLPSNQNQAARPAEIALPQCLSYSLSLAALWELRSSPSRGRRRHWDSLRQQQPTSAQRWDNTADCRMEQPCFRLKRLLWPSFLLELDEAEISREKRTSSKFDGHWILLFNMQRSICYHHVKR